MRPNRSRGILCRQRHLAWLLRTVRTIPPSKPISTQSVKCFAQFKPHSPQSSADSVPLCAAYAYRIRSMMIAEARECQEECSLALPTCHHRLRERRRDSASRCRHVGTAVRMGRQLHCSVGTQRCDMRPCCHRAADRDCRANRRRSAEQPFAQSRQACCTNLVRTDSRARRRYCTDAARIRATVAGNHVDRSVFSVNIPSCGLASSVFSLRFAFLTQLTRPSRPILSSR